MLRLYACGISARRRKDGNIFVSTCAVKAHSKDEAKSLALHYAGSIWDVSLFNTHTVSAFLIDPDYVAAVAADIGLYGKDQYRLGQDPDPIPSVFADAFSNEENQDD